ncbi:MAG: flagellar type III secretion system pore protein FliP [Deltaproteobacteria bacterium]|nr:flagellar type III secretion system pore protein FliP [Deltaproteobacteria bacterium]
MLTSRKLLLFSVASLGATGAVLLCASPAWAQSMPNIQVSMHPADGPDQVVPALKILGMLTILSVAPAILISMTSFTRIVVVLSFVRQAIGSQNVPPMQIILALSLLFTAVVMAPTAHRIDQEALSPYMAEEIDEAALYERSSDVMKDFLLPQTREDDLALFYDMSDMDRPDTASEVSLLMLVPAFMISELRTGFEMGFLLFLPFVLVDLIVASILTSMGMVMLPPTMLSTPLKLLLFVVVDGWSLITHSLISSFQ